MSDVTAHPSAGWARWQRSWWYHAVLYARTWRGSVISTAVFPLLFLAAMGVGVGHLVSQHAGRVQGLSYLDFIAPGLLATTAMQIGEGESTWSVLGAVKWQRTYHAAISTPLEPEDVLLGKLSWVGTRALATGVIYTVIIGLFGALHSWWALSLPLVATLIALAFAAPLVAWTCTLENEGALITFYRFAIVPMFLFSATFYPVSAYPGYLRPLVQLAPLYHGVALARAGADGHGSLGALSAHVAVLGVMAVAGLLWGRHTLRRRLVN